MKKYLSEFMGTAVLVLIGCGSASIASTTLGNLGIAMAFGLAITAIFYTIGDISGCHINPAVSLAMLLNKKMTLKEFIRYVIAQILGAIFGIAILYLITTCSSMTISSLGQNGYAEASNVGLNVIGAFIVEVVLSFIFILTILKVTANPKTKNIAGIVIGLTLTAVHIIGIPLTGTSVNPARSLAPAIFAGGIALEQVWLFILAPLVGAVLASIVNKICRIGDGS